jgi:large subunit ribosomal protein L17
MTVSLFDNETISTTIRKAKEVKGFAEKLITLAKRGTLAARRRAIALLGDRDIIKEEEGGPIKKGTVIGKLFSELGPRYLDRKGGYTRIIHLAKRRLGDNGELVLLQLVGAEQREEKPKGGKKGKKAKEKEPAKSAAAAQ